MEGDFPHFLPICYFKEQSPFSYAIGVGLILGVCISYIPQFIAIIRRRSSVGIAWQTVLLANISTCSNTINAIFEQWETVACCRLYYTPLQCAASTLSIAQIATGFINSTIFYILVLAFFPSEREEEEFKMSGQEQRYMSSSSFRSKWRLPGTNRIRARYAGLVYLILNILLIPATIGVLLWFYGPGSKEVTDFAFAMGIVSSLAVVLQWTPQIVKTFRAKAVGSLSILMLILQAPGSFLVVIFQGVLEGKSVSTWLAFLLTGIQQMVLLIECLIFYFRNKKREQARSINGDEREKLLYETPY
eukprot:TRINITY_DN6628_c0_g1_i1.p1 TRINITY_DN6628_c0_g1~~TRINITY_DN6628_c0_g1_i1.p1  ORF type:complete len:303 (-),score=49.56 TRINITY_DN6628_c0_g1_i1:51-959(-)